MGWLFAGGEGGGSGSSSSPNTTIPNPRNIEKRRTRVGWEGWESSVAGCCGSGATVLPRPSSVDFRGFAKFLQPPASVSLFSIFNRNFHLAYKTTKTPYKNLEVHQLINSPVKLSVKKNYQKLRGLLDIYFQGRIKQTIV